MPLPCDGQNTQTIYSWAQTLQIGDDVAIRQSHAYTDFEYSIRKVEAFSQGNSRVVVEKEGSFYRSEKSAGNNCIHPKGQRMMIEPTPAVRAAAEAGGRYRAH